jgi:hypothetical protein
VWAWALSAVMPTCFVITGQLNGSVGLTYFLL